MRRAGALAGSLVLVGGTVACAPLVITAVAHSDLSARAYAILTAPYVPTDVGAGTFAGLNATTAVVGETGILVPAPTVSPLALASGTRSLAVDPGVIPGSDPLAVITVDPSASVRPGGPLAAPVIEDTLVATISTSVPPVSFGAGDGLPETLARGQSYTVHMPIVGADPSAAQTASIIGRGFVGDAACTDVALLPAGVTDVTCTITVRANALSVYVRGAAGGVGSRKVRHVVDPLSKAPASVAATLPAASPYGAPGSVDVGVTAAGYIPRGTVTAIVDGVPGPSVSLVSGVAAVPLPALLPVGPHTVGLRYAGDSWVGAVDSAEQRLVVTRAQVQLAGRTLLATDGVRVAVSVEGPLADPGGTVTISENGAALGRAVVLGGTASVLLPASLPSGRHTLTLGYSGTSSVERARATLVVVIP